MNVLEGYLCQVIKPGRNIFFGKKTSQGIETDWENFRTSFTPFGSYQKVEIAERKLSRIHRKLMVVSIDLAVAETEQEAERFKREKEIVVIKVCKDIFDQEKHPYLERIIYGPKLTPDNSTLPGTPFDETLATFKDYKAADYLRSEITRQAQTPALLAVLRLERV